METGFGNRFWNPDSETGFRNQLGISCRNWFWKLVLETGFGNRFWKQVLEPGFGNWFNIQSSSCFLIVLRHAHTGNRIVARHCHHMCLDERQFPVHTSAVYYSSSSAHELPPPGGLAAA